MKAIAKLMTLMMLILVLEGCSSGKKAFEKGDYFESVLKAVERLRKNPNHKKSRETIKYAYPAALDYLQTEITNLQAGSQRLKWGRIVSAYEQINRMGDEIRRSPGAKSIIKSPAIYASKLTEARNMAAEEHYAEGQRLINPNNRQSSKDAFYMFQRANGYVAGYKDALNKMEEAREYATLKVVLEQIPVPGRYSLSANFFQDKVEEFLRTGGIRRNEFIRFYNPREAESIRLQADHKIGRAHV